MKQWAGVFFAMLVSAMGWAQPISTVVVFGDSLSDKGNIYEYTKHRMPAAPGYYQGRFSNGPIWPELLANQLFPKSSSTHLLDYAFGGAGVLEMKGDSFVLSQEIDSYLLAHETTDCSQSLFVLWIGANDYLLNPEMNDADSACVTKAILNSVQRLVDKGAQHIMLVNLPDLGHTPLGYELELVEPLSQITQLHNQLLHNEFYELQHRYPDLKWVYVDINHLFADMINHPSVYGLANTTERCFFAKPLFLKPGSQQRTKFHYNDECLGFLFFDNLHPTKEVHQVISAYMMNALADAGIHSVDLAA